MESSAKTPLPRGHDNTAGAADVSPRTVQQAQEDTRQAAARITATISGIADGIVEGLERYPLADATEAALHEGAELVRATTQEARDQWDRPEAQELARSAPHLGGKVRVPVQDGSAATRSKFDTQRGQLAKRMERGQERVREGLEIAQHGADRVRVTVRDKASAVQSSAAAVRETRRRGGLASAGLRQRLGRAVGASVRSVGIALGGYAAAGLVGAIALVLLSIGSVVGFNLLLGTPWGYFITAGIYALVAVATGVGANAGARHERHEAREQVGEARRTVRDVTAPIRHPTLFVPPQRNGGAVRREAGFAVDEDPRSGRPGKVRRLPETQIQE